MLREAARCALQHNPSSLAADALRTALSAATDPAWQGALALALGARQDAASVPLLAKLVSGKDEAAVSAALFALGKIADAEAARVLAGAQTRVPEKLRAEAAEAYMKCAERLLREGQAAQAAAIYQQFDQPSQPRAVRLAALAGTLKSSGDAAAARILEILAGDNADARAVALGFVPELDQGGLSRLANGLGQLPSATQIQLLGMLAEHGEKSALPVALRFAKDPDESLRQAGLLALGRLGDASSVVVLVEAMQAGGGAGGTARESLSRLSAPGVNEAIVVGMQRENEAGRRAALIEVLEARGASVAVPVLLAECVSDQAAVRRAAMRALGKLAQAQDLPAMAKGLLKAAPGSERDDAAKALAAACTRTPEAGRQAEPILALYREASAADRLVLLPVLGRLGGSGAFVAIREALASTDSATYEAGVAALSNWPDSDEAVEGELLARAQKAEKPADRAGALRAYLRVLSQPSGLSDLEKLKKFEKGMALAERNDERNLVLERVADLRRIETLRFVVPYLEQPALATRAGNTICDLARERGFVERHKAEFEQALNKVLTTCKDPGVIERAKRRLQAQ
jgi:HEAT repeat protein